MKICMAEQTGARTPQFIVEPENEDERTILGMFFSTYSNNSERYKFHLHGWGYAGGKFSSFNFGLIEHKKATLAGCLLAWLRRWIGVWRQ